MGNKLLCGAGKANITPPATLLPTLPGLMGKRFSGVVYDELFVRAMVLKNGTEAVLLVSFDLDKAPNPAKNLTLLSAHTGIPEENILFFAVHTHTAPIHGIRPYDGPNSKDKMSPDVQAAMDQYEAYLQSELLQAVDAALASLRPAKIGWATGESYIHVNRCQDYDVEQPDGSIRHCCSLGANPEGPVDHTLFVLKIEDMKGQPIAFFVNYAVHCCVMIGNDSDGAGKVGISGDIAGTVSQMLERKYGGVALWSSGPAGDVNPIWMNQYYYPDPETGAVTEHIVSGAEAALAALKVLSARHFADIANVIRRISCDTAEAALSAREIWCEPCPDYHIRLHPIRIGDLMLCGISGELYSSLGRVLQAASTAQHTCVINHDACLLSNAGYIMDDETIDRCRYNLPGHHIPGYGKNNLQSGRVVPALTAALETLQNSL